MSKFREQYLKPTYFKTKDHWMVGTVWPVKGSKDNEYSVELTDSLLVSNTPIPIVMPKDR